MVFAALAYKSRADIPIAISEFGILCGLAFIVSLAAAYLAAKTDVGISLRHVIFWCAVIRLLAVFGEPVYEDDYYRYLWDGRITAETGKPYEFAPSAYFDVDLESPWEDILSNINHPTIRTVYGPVNQYVFAAAYLIDPGKIWVLQVLFALFDLGVIVILSKLATLGPLVLYGFSPLIVKEFAMTAHPDIICVLALCAATLAWKRDRNVLAAAMLAIAVGSKLFAFLLVPLLLRFNWRGWAMFAATLALLHLPLADPTGTAEALSAMAQFWVFNAPLYYLFASLVGFQELKVLLVAGFAALCAVYFFRSQYHLHGSRNVPRADCLYFAMLLAIPVFNPWYYVFVLAFAVIYPSVWAWLGSASLLFAYATGLQLDIDGLNDYGQPVWSLVAAFAPIAAAMCFSFYKGRRAGRS